MRQLIQTEFGLKDIEVTRLNGYENINYLIKTKTAKYVFKTYSYTSEIYDLVKAENKTLAFLQKKESLKYPKPIPFLEGCFVKILNINGENLVCRMLTFIEGASLGSIKHTKKLFQSFGIFLADFNLKLQNFTNHTIAAREWGWEIKFINLNKKFIKDIPNAKDRNIIHYFFQQFDKNVLPVLHNFRKQIIHNDANEWNVLAENGEVASIIDFGDLAYSILINELAIAIAYGCFDKENPLKWASFIIEAYHSKLPLKEAEIKILYYLIATRLIISVTNSAHSRIINPENSYANVSEKQAWKVLYKWVKINPLAAENSFRLAIGLPITNQQSISKVVKKRQQHISSILSLSYDKPIHMVGAAFQYMYDAQGNTFLDAYNNIPHVGHAHPKVVAAGQKQMAKLNTNTRYLYDQLADYSEKLLTKFPPSLNKVFFVNSGSAASDLALRLAKYHTNHKKIMVIEHGYHGNTQTDIDISDYKFNNPKGEGQKDFILKTEIPDTYRGKYTGKNAGKRYAKEAIENIENSDNSIAAFIS